MGLAVLLALLICIVAIVGSLITIRHQSMMSYLDHRVLFYGIAELWGQYQVYWIILLIILIALLAINTIVCTIDKVCAVIRQKGTWKRILPHVVHFGFLVALAGHLLGSVAGFKSSGNILYAGELRPVAEVKGLSVRLDDFTATEDDLGYRDYMSTTVSLFKDSEKILTGDISLNHPLLYKGMAFYYNDDGSLPTGIRVLRDGVLEEVSLNGPDGAEEHRLSVTGVYPDFALDQAGRPFSRSEQFRNPYVRLTMDGKSAFLKMGRHALPVYIDDVEIKFAGYILMPYVVLSINKDPGIWIVVFGSSILLLGMLLLIIFGVDKRELMRVPRLRHDGGAEA